MQNLGSCNFLPLLNNGFMTVRISNSEKKIKWLSCFIIHQVLARIQRKDEEGFFFFLQKKFPLVQDWGESD